MSERTLLDPALDVEVGVLLGALSGGQRLQAESLDRTAVLLVIVAAVGRHPVGRRRRGRPFLPRTGGAGVFAAPLGEVGIGRFWVGSGEGKDHSRDSEILPPAAP
ncbi:hypothetical protein OG252_43975 [Streptomyces sp. NBC_01352]|uniref:hypothetical protein n=1 Tax=Streptomyces sp. NBC_01352 TaxID=2903834 RepID=UPI002E340322|nr:hypothetical protein [Streptomyces sp. NBC_01352]